MLKRGQRGLSVRGHVGNVTRGVSNHPRVVQAEGPSDKNSASTEIRCAIAYARINSDAAIAADRSPS